MSSWASLTLFCNSVFLLTQYALILPLFWLLVIVPFTVYYSPPHERMVYSARRCSILLYRDGQVLYNDWETMLWSLLWSHHIVSVVYVCVCMSSIKFINYLFLTIVHLDMVRLQFHAISTRSSHTQTRLGHICHLLACTSLPSQKDSSDWDRLHTILTAWHKNKQLDTVWSGLQNIYPKSQDAVYSSFIVPVRYTSLKHYKVFLETVANSI